MSDRVLLIDDDNRLVDGLKLRLSAVGYDVQVARNGEEGVSLAATFRPHTIICDVRMPKMDGLEVCRLLREVSDLLDIPIIVLSASTANSTAQAIIEAGGNIFMHKPYDFGHLQSVVRHLVERRQLHEVLEEKAIQQRACG